LLLPEGAARGPDLPYPLATPLGRSVWLLVGHA